jgi:hypothetical protein
VNFLFIYLFFWRKEFEVICGVYQIWDHWECGSRPYGQIQRPGLLVGYYLIRASESGQ